MYILNKHWDKVDNYRIDKFLALLRHMFSQMLNYIKEQDYSAQVIEWYEKTMLRYLLDNLSAQGICLQICDIFIPELGKTDKELSMN